ncbi:MAG: NUDIX hydrolase [Actinobacteria bacterium]|nr:MAG: NUDIX hydrolase [Actinomycetota bacterium]
MRFRSRAGLLSPISDADSRYTWKHGPVNLPPVTRTIRAAGGVVLKKTSKGNLRVLISHRPRYDDWSFPKGKMDKGETPEETAIREILEETGYHCRIVAPLRTTRYRVGSGIKEVDWFAMRPLPDSPGFKKNSEVDEIQWVGRKEAKKALDYEHDRNLIRDFDLKKLAETGTIHLLRHGAAGNRDKWNGDDRLRPLTKKGRRQAEAIARQLEGREIERIFTSPYKRCIQTVEPLAKAIGAEIEVSDALAEGPDVDASYELIHNLAGSNAVLCSHGDVIPATMTRLMWLGLSLHSRFYCSKGSIWEVDIKDGRFTDGRYVPPPKP